MSDSVGTFLVKNKTIIGLKYNEVITRLLDTSELKIRL